MIVLGIAAINKNLKIFLKSNVQTIFVKFTQKQVHKMQESTNQEREGLTAEIMFSYWSISNFVSKNFSAT